jgi:hypothetical protein
MRDPARAALMGILPGANFGNEYDDGDFGADYGAEFGYFGADAPPPVPAAAPQHPYYPQHPAYRGHHAPVGHHLAHHADPNAQHALAHQWREHERALEHERSRERLLNPNAGSHIKVERYDFSLNNQTGSLALGTPSAIYMSGQPAVTFRPNRLITNAPAPGFVTFDTIMVANVAGTIGQSTDAFTYAAVAQDSRLDLPTLSPANVARISGSYTGYTPAGYTVPMSFPFIATFQGPAEIVA